MLDHHLHDDDHLHHDNHNHNHDDDDDHHHHHHDQDDHDDHDPHDATQALATGAWMVAEEEPGQLRLRGDQLIIDHYQLRS